MIPIRSAHPTPGRTEPGRTAGPVRAYYAATGPRDGRLRPDDLPVVPVVFDVPEPQGDPAGAAVGLAWPVACAAGPDGPVAAFRLEIGGRPLAGLWMLDRRRFVALDDRPGARA
jgi:hypothetical protein